VLSPSSQYLLAHSKQLPAPVPTQSLQMSSHSRHVSPASLGNSPVGHSATQEDTPDFNLVAAHTEHSFKVGPVQVVQKSSQLEHIGFVGSA
jgi:hypothetical protein